MMLLKFFSASMFMIIMNTILVIGNEIAFYPITSGLNSCTIISSYNVNGLYDCQRHCLDEGTCQSIAYKVGSGSSDECKLCSNLKGQDSGFRTYNKDISNTIEGCDARDFNIIWVLDESGSVGETNYRKMLEFSTDLTSSIAHHSAVKIVGSSLIEFSKRINNVPVMSDVAEASKIVDLKAVEMIAHAAKDHFRAGGTNIAAGLDNAREIILASGLGTINIVVLLSDGKPTQYTVKDGNTYSNDAEAKAYAIIAAEKLTAIADTHLLYGSIKHADKTLFNSLGNDVALVEIDSWHLAGFAQQILEEIGRAACKPTPAPITVTNPPTPYPTPSPTPSPTPRPTLDPNVCTILRSGTETIKFPRDNEKFDSIITTNNVDWKIRCF